LPQRTSKRWVQSVDPTTGKTLRKLKAATKPDVERAVEKARKAFGKWREFSPSRRAIYLERTAKTFRAQKEKLGRLITLEMGKTLRESVSEVNKCAWALEYYAQNGEKFLNPEAAKTDATDSYIAFEPLGVIASIMPWNFPMWQSVRFAGPALMAGNTVVFKPSSTTPQTWLALAKAFESTGIPSGVFSVVVGGPDVSNYLIQANTSAVSFTGSVQAGRGVAALASERLKKVVLELGGSDPFIVLDDADIEAASSGAVAGRFINCGQSCIASKRFFIVKRVAEEFLEHFIKKTKSLRVGDPLQPETDIGPMVREDALESLDGQVRDSVEEGARIMLGGERIKRRGFFYAPTVMTDVTPEMRVMKEETFGPVAPIMVVSDSEEAVKFTNQSDFGLGASVWGTDIRGAEKVASKVATGLVTVNNVVVSDPRMPFGGVKNSGVGRELSRYGLLEFTNIKSVRLYEKSPIAHARVE
jgi:succinate-semialdehyde dehydrogenase/glutarate-semialdehyde dehydrogenase/succinyl-CoA reductase